MFLSNKLKSSTDSAKFLKNQISEMNRSSTIIKDKPELYNIEGVDDEDDDVQYKKDNKTDDDANFSKDLIDLPFMKNKPKNLINNENDNSNDEDDGLDDYNKYESNLKNNNREFD